MSSNGPKKGEVVVLAGVRARMAAYQQEIQRKQEARKKNLPVFKVEDDLGPSLHSSDGGPAMDKLPVDDDPSMSQVDTQEDDSHAFQRSMNQSMRVEFIVTDDDLVEEPEKPQEVKDQEEKVAKEKIGKLLSSDDSERDEEPIVLQAFSSVQRRYLKAVTKLRPKPMEVPTKAENAKDDAAAEESVVKATKDVIRKTLDRELTKSHHLTELTTTWDDYYEKAQDKPTEEAELKRVDNEIKQVEEEVNADWSEFAEQVVEIVGEGDDDEADSDMVKWREEARRLKAEAEERKVQKAAREARKKKRAQIAALRKKRAAEAAAKKKAEEEEAARKEDEAKGKDKTRKKKGDESDSESSSSSGSSSSKGKGKGPSSPKGKKSKLKKTKKVEEESDSESSVEEAAKTKKKSKKKKEKEKEKDKKKEKDMVDFKEKTSKKKSKKKKGDDDSDLDDGWVEEYPRNFDGTLWRNPLKFWTNKPKKVNEVAPKVIMRVRIGCVWCLVQFMFVFFLCAFSFQLVHSQIPIRTFFARAKMLSTTTLRFIGINSRETSMCWSRSRAVSEHPMTRLVF